MGGEGDGRGTLAARERCRRRPWLPRVQAGRRRRGGRGYLGGEGGGRLGGQSAAGGDRRRRVGMGQAVGGTEGGTGRGS